MIGGLSFPMYGFREVLWPVEVSGNQQDCFHCRCAVLALKDVDNVESYIKNVYSTSWNLIFFEVLHTGTKYNFLTKHNWFELNN